jgi:hypothetical protein
MRILFAPLSALVSLACFAQEAELTSLLARLQRLPIEQVQSLQARLALDPAPAAKKAYHELHLAYVLASRQGETDPKGTKALVERSLKTYEGVQEPESRALLGAMMGVKISFSAMSGMTLGPRAAKLFDEALAQRPGNPRITLLKAIHLLHTPAFVGGGAKVALPLMEQAVALAEKEPVPTDPWAPSWGRVESLEWLAYTQAVAGQAEAARKTADRVLAQDPKDGFIAKMVLPKLQGKDK